MASRIELDRIIVKIARLLREVPKESVEELIKKLGHTIDFGCFTDPTNWIAHSDQLEREKKLLEHFVKLYDLLEVEQVEC